MNPGPLALPRPLRLKPVQSTGLSGNAKEGQKTEVLGEVAGQGRLGIVKPGELEHHC